VSVPGGSQKTSSSSSNLQTRPDGQSFLPLSLRHRATCMYQMIFLCLSACRFRITQTHRRGWQRYTCYRALRAIRKESNWHITISSRTAINSLPVTRRCLVRARGALPIRHGHILPIQLCCYFLVFRQGCCTMRCRRTTLMSISSWGVLIGLLLSRVF